MTRATSGPVPHVDDQTLLIIDELAETADVDACVRYVCGQVEVDLDMGNGATTSERTPATHGDKRHTQRRILPGSTIVDPVRASALVAALKAKLVDLDEATRALYNAEHVRAEKARSSQAAIELRAQEVQGSLEALRESLGRLGSDVGGSLERLEALYGGLEEVRETSAVVEGGLRTMGRVEEAMRLLSSSTTSTAKSTTTRSKGASNGELRSSSSSSYATLYHAARLYVQSLREVKGKSSLSEPLVGSLPAVCQRVHALKPLLDARVDGLVHEFLRWQQDECAARLGRDAMAGVGIASGRYRLDPLSWAVVVTKAYGGDLGRVREVYVGQREGQLGRVLEGSLEGGFVVSGARLEAVVAFFLVEMAVAEGVGLDTVEFLKTMWDGVGAAIGAAVGAACDECDGWEVCCACACACACVSRVATVPPLMFRRRAASGERHKPPPPASQPASQPSEPPVLTYSRHHHDNVYSGDAGDEARGVACGEGPPRGRVAAGDGGADVESDEAVGAV